MSYNCYHNIQNISHVSFGQTAPVLQWKPGYGPGCSPLGESTVSQTGSYPPAGSHHTPGTGSSLYLPPLPPIATAQTLSRSMPSRKRVLSVQNPLTLEFLDLGSVKLRSSSGGTSVAQEAADAASGDVSPFGTAESGDQVAVRELPHKGKVVIAVGQDPMQRAPVVESEREGPDASELRGVTVAVDTCIAGSGANSSMTGEAEDAVSSDAAVAGDPTHNPGRNSDFNVEDGRIKDNRAYLETIEALESKVKKLRAAHCLEFKRARLLEKEAVDRERLFEAQLTKAAGKPTKLEEPRDMEAPTPMEGDEGWNAAGTSADEGSDGAAREEMSKLREANSVWQAWAKEAELTNNTLIIEIEDLRQQIAGLEETEQRLTADVSIARERQEDAEHISGLATDSLQELEVKYQDDINRLNSLLQVASGERNALMRENEDLYDRIAERNAQSYDLSTQLAEKNTRLVAVEAARGGLRAELNALQQGAAQYFLDTQERERVAGQQVDNLLAMVSYGLKEQERLGKEVGKWSKEALQWQAHSSHHQAEADRLARREDFLRHTGAIDWVADRLAGGDFGAEGVGLYHRVQRGGQLTLDAPTPGPRQPLLTHLPPAVSTREATVGEHLSLPVALPQPCQGGASAARSPAQTGIAARRGFSTALSDVLVGNEATRADRCGAPGSAPASVPMVLALTAAAPVHHCQKGVPTATDSQRRLAMVVESCAPNTELNSKRDVAAPRCQQAVVKPFSPSISIKADSTACGKASKNGLFSRILKKLGPSMCGSVNVKGEADTIRMHTKGNSKRSAAAAPPSLLR